MSSLILPMSDYHYAKQTDSYNVVAAQKVLPRITRQLIPIINRHDIEKIHVLKVGDMIDGESIYPTQSHHVDNAAGHARVQVKQLTRFMRDWIQEDLLTLVPRVDVDGVLGNHGRTSKYNHEGSNWDLQYYDSLAWACDSIDGVNVNYSEKFYDIIPVEGLKFLIYHGYSIKMYQRIPYYGMEDRIKSWARAIGGFDHAILGHFHTYGMISWNGIRIFANGTAVTDDDWALETIGKLGETTWHGLVIEDDEIVTQYPIELGGN